MASLSNWENPYKEQNRYRQDLAHENYKKVQRRKEEDAIMRGLQNNVRLTVEDLKKQHEEERSNKQRALEEQRAVNITKQEDDTERPPPVQCVGCFDAKVRCLETTHGGATIWTGHDDGTLAIRNGVTGEAVYVIEAAAPDLDDSNEAAGGGVPPAVTTLYNAESHMWVGLSDGTIRIYDTLVYVLAFESKMHDGAITCFANTFDAKVFSASEDGTIVKWDTEAGNFEVLAHLKDNPFVVRCLTTYGYNAFAGGDGNVIQQFDTETCAEVHVYEGHTARVNCVVVAEGFLVSASDDCKVIIWSIDTAQAFHEITAHSSPVKSLFVDGVAQRVWSTDTSGVVNIWGMSPSMGFPVLSCFQTDEEAAIHHIKGVVAVDAVKLWSLGSDGNNKVWHSATNRIEGQTNIAVDAMRAIIAEDAVELAKWNELIKTMKAVGQKLKRSVATTLNIVNQRSEQRDYFSLWLQWLLQRYSAKKRVLIVGQLERARKTELLRRYYEVLYNDQRKKKEARRKVVIAQTLEDGERRERIAESYRRIRAYAVLVRSRRSRQLLADQLAIRSDNVMLKKYYTRWEKFGLAGHGRKKREQMAQVLSRGSLNGLRRLYYQRWIRSHMLLQSRQQASASSAGLCLRRDNQLMGQYLQLWISFAAKKRLAKNTARTAAMMFRRCDRNVLAAYYTKLHCYAFHRLHEAHRVDLSERQDHYKSLLDKIKGVEGLVRRRKLLDDAQAAINVASSERDLRLQRITELKAELAEARGELADKRAGAQAKRQKTMSEQVEDLIANLKVKVLNFHQDYALIHKTQERIKSDRGNVVKLFLEGHISVKKIVVDITRETYLDPEKEWPLTEDMVRKMKSHNNEPVLTAIKTMVIAFDTMSSDDRASMTTDAEIVLNAKWLQLFAQVCIEQRIKKLGKAGSTRVK